MIKKSLITKLCLGLVANSLLLTSCYANDMLNLLNNLANTSKASTQNTFRQPLNKTNPVITRSIVYSGYSKDFLIIKNLVINGQSLQAYELQNQKIIKTDSVNFLNSNEAGLLALDTDTPLAAIEHFSAAEHFLKVNAEKSVVEDGFFSFGGEALGLITGIGDLTEYSGAPFERILMLNYKSIAYLLNGERKAYNVTRRAIDWQNIEQKEFERNIDSVKKNIAKEEKKVTPQSTERSNPYANKPKVAGNIFQVIAGQYKSSKKEALTVSSAYVNPFGFYMAGIVQEFDSFEDSSLRDNARISYKKALKLNPKSKVIKQAIREVKRRPRRGKRLVQVVVADGFAPEKKTMQFGLPMPGGMVPVKLPIYTPTPSKVAHIKIKSGKRTLATLSTVANIEAIVLRHQLDSLPLEHFKVMASIARSTAENMLWGQLGGLGQIGKSFRESFANPDMRAWMSLPKRLLAARFYASKRLKKITIVSYDKRWHRLATKAVRLPKNIHSFIYVRTIDSVLNVNINKTLWVK